MTITVAGVDPALSNMGLAKFELDLKTFDLRLLGLGLVSTEKMTGKSVRQNSDDLRRAMQLQRALREWLSDCTVCFAEIPSGSQHSRSALGFGIAIGVLASSDVPILEVMPLETKVAALGKKSASKREIIDWASAKYPDGGWLRLRGKPDGRLIDDNEHMADACAIVHAGLQTPEFQRLAAVWKATS